MYAYKNSPLPFPLPSFLPPSFLPSFSTRKHNSYYYSSFWFHSYVIVRGGKWNLFFVLPPTFHFTQNQEKAEMPAHGYICICLCFPSFSMGRPPFLENFPDFEYQAPFCFHAGLGHAHPDDSTHCARAQTAGSQGHQRGLSCIG